MKESGGHDHDHGSGGISFKKVVVYLFVSIVVIGLILYLF
jgi:hypothetical protein